MSCTTNNIKNSLNTKDICAIIEKCKDTGITKLIYRDLYISFQDRNVNEESLPPNLLSQEEKAESNDIFKAERESIVEDETSLKLERLARMNIEDPMQFEDLLMREELGEEENAETESS